MESAEWPPRCPPTVKLTCKIMREHDSAVFSTRESSIIDEPDSVLCYTSNSQDLKFKKSGGGGGGGGRAEMGTVR